MDHLRDRHTLTISDLTEALDISRRTLERWRSEGAFPAPRVMPGGRAVRWDTAEVLDWWDGLERAA